MLFVPPTPRGILVKELRKREDELCKNNSDRIKIVEKAGMKLENILVKKNPFKKTKCEEKSCVLCKNTSKEQTVFCNSNNVGYRWICTTCKDKNVTMVYEGESSRSARLRGGEHMRGLKNKNINNVLYKHKLLEHKMEEPKFLMEITGVFQDALSRQANEAIRITSRPSTELMNSKNEFNHPPIARIVVEKVQFKAKHSPGL